jgi:hypothetical protein
LKQIALSLSPEPDQLLKQHLAMNINIMDLEQKLKDVASIDLNKPIGEDLQKSDTKTLKKIDEILEDSDMLKDKEDD